MSRPDRTPVGRFLSAALILTLIMPSPALALWLRQEEASPRASALRVQAGAEGDSKPALSGALAAGAESETLITKTETGEIPIGERGFSDEAVIREPAVRTLTFDLSKTPLKKIELVYDALGQLHTLSMDWVKDDRARIVPVQTVPLGDGRVFRFSYDSIPKVWIENPKSKFPRFFSAYNLVENMAIPDGRAVAPRSSRVTIAYFAHPDGRFIPAQEAFDHDQAFTFLQQQKWDANSVTVLNHDSHPDAGSAEKHLSIGNWIGAVKERRLAREVIWVASKKRMLKTKASSIDSIVSNPAEVHPQGERVMASYDLDYFSQWDWAADRGRLLKSVPNRSQILHRVRRLVRAYLKNQVRFSAVDFTRSAFSRKGHLDFSPRAQSNFILNALINEHQPLLGKPVFQRSHESFLPEPGNTDSLASLISTAEASAMEKKIILLLDEYCLFDEYGFGAVVSHLGDFAPRTIVLLHSMTSKNNLKHLRSLNPKLQFVTNTRELKEKIDALRSAGATGPVEFIGFPYNFSGEPEFMGSRELVNTVLQTKSASTLVARLGAPAEFLFRHFASGLEAGRIDSVPAAGTEQGSLTSEQIMKGLAPLDAMSDPEVIALDVDGVLAGDDGSVIQPETMAVLARLVERVRINPRLRVLLLTNTYPASLHDRVLKHLPAEVLERVIPLPTSGALSPHVNLKIPPAAIEVFSDWISSKGGWVILKTDGIEKHVGLGWLTPESTEKGFIIVRAPDDPGRVIYLEILFDPAWRDAQFAPDPQARQHWLEELQGLLRSRGVPETDPALRMLRVGKSVQWIPHKLEALSKWAAAEGIPPERIWFVDDGADNVVPPEGIAWDGPVIYSGSYTPALQQHPQVIQVAPPEHSGKPQNGEEITRMVLETAIAKLDARATAAGTEQNKETVRNRFSGVDPNETVQVIHAWDVSDEEWTLKLLKFTDPTGDPWFMELTGEEPEAGPVPDTEITHLSDDESGDYRAIKEIEMPVAELLRRVENSSNVWHHYIAYPMLMNYLEETVLPDVIRRQKEKGERTLTLVTDFADLEQVLSYVAALIRAIEQSGEWQPLEGDEPWKIRFRGLTPKDSHAGDMERGWRGFSPMLLPQLLPPWLVEASSEQLADLETVAYEAGSLADPEQMKEAQVVVLMREHRNRAVKEQVLNAVEKSPGTWLVLAGDLPTNAERLRGRWVNVGEISSPAPLRVIRPAAGMEQFQPVFNQLMREDDALRGTLSAKKWARLTPEQAAAFKVKGVNVGFVIAHSARVTDAAHAIFADDRLGNKYAQKLFPWVGAGRGVWTVVENALKMQARKGDLILIRAEEGVSGELVEELLRTFGPQAESAPRAAIGDEASIRSLLPPAFELLATEEAFRSVAVLSVVVRLKDAAGNTYTLVLMA